MIDLSQMMKYRREHEIFDSFDICCYQSEYSSQLPFRIINVAAETIAGIFETKIDFLIRDKICFLFRIKNRKQH